MNADSKSLLGATPLALISADWSLLMIPPNCVLFQSLFDAIRALLELRISSVGLASASVIPKGSNDGPIARMIIFLFEPLGPCTMNPSIRALSPVPTGRRVETLPTSPVPGVAVAVAVGVAAGVDVAVAVALALGEAVAVAVAVALGVAVAVAVGVG